MNAGRFARLLETDKCASIVCVFLSFIDSISLTSIALDKGEHLARLAFSVRQQITRREQVPLHLDCVFQFMNVLRPRKLNTPLDDRPEVCYFVQDLVSYPANPETVAPGVSFF